MVRKVTFLVLMVAAVLGLGATAASTSADDSTVAINLVSLAGWTGEVDPSSTDAGMSGGAATIAAYWQNERASNPNTLALGTGNSFGTSPPISNLFSDEPALSAMNAMGFDADTLGNDNFDHGIAYLQRLLTMADFPFVSANLTNVDQNLSGVSPYRIFETGGVKVAVIGLTDPASPSVVFPGNFGTITVGNPAIAAFKAREQAAAAGAQVFVLITEMGVTETPADGPLLDLARQLDGFDVILGNGNSTNFRAVINGAQVVAGMNRGQYYGRTSLQFDTSAQKVLSIKTDFVQPLVANVTPVASIAATLDVYRGELAAKLSQTIATATSVIAEGDACGNVLGRTCESITGDIVGDALRAVYGADVAITNAGAMRSSLTCPMVDSSADFCPPYSGLPAPITEGQVQAILPFSNFAAVATVSGAELKAMLENGVSTVLDVAGRFPQVSGICFWYDISRAPGSRIVSAVKQGADGACDGAAVDFSAGASYVLATNDFVAAGGDGYAALDDVSLRERLDIVVSRYLADLESITPRIEGRINCLGAACPRLLEGAALPLPSSSGTSGGSSGPVVRPPATGDGGLR